MNNGRGGRQGFCLSPILLVTYSLYQLDLYTGNTLPRELLKVLETSKEEDR